MEVDSIRGGVVKTGSKRTYSGELASSPHPQSQVSASSPQSVSTPSADTPRSLMVLISQVFRVAFSVSLYSGPSLIQIPIFIAILMCIKNKQVVPPFKMYYFTNPKLFNECWSQAIRITVLLLFSFPPSPSLFDSTPPPPPPNTHIHRII